MLMDDDDLLLDLPDELFSCESTVGRQYVLEHTCSVDGTYQDNRDGIISKYGKYDWSIYDDLSGTLALYSFVEYYFTIHRHTLYTIYKANDALTRSACELVTNMEDTRYMKIMSDTNIMPYIFHRIWSVGKESYRAWC